MSARGGNKGTVGVGTLIALIGRDATLRICKEYASYKIPSAIGFLREQRNARIVALYRRGHDVGSIALRFSMGTTQVWRILKKAAKRIGKPVDKSGTLYELPPEDDE